MKNQINQTHFLFAFLLFILINSGYSQTNVTGGIFTNTTWTLPNSPYIVTDTVAVFPNITLTIDPGVIVKFNSNAKLWIKQGTLIAEGTISDSIIFTSNLSTPVIASWDQIFLDLPIYAHFNFCKIQYSDQGIKSTGGSNSLSETIKNSIFCFNQKATYAVGNIDSCVYYNNVYSANVGGYNRVLSNSRIDNNQYGIQGGIIINCNIDSNNYYGVYEADSITGCKIKYNGIGLKVPYGYRRINHNIIDSNNIGIQIDDNPYPVNIFCNKICNNLSYDLQYFGTSSSLNVTNNYWCTADSATIETHIYDGFDNVSYQLVYFMPVDTLECYTDSIIISSLQSVQNFSFNIYPNPVINNLVLKLPNYFTNSSIQIFNSIGIQELQLRAMTNLVQIDVSTLSPGVYFLECITNGFITNQKFIKQ